jgi:hypothetical protein
MGAQSNILLASTSPVASSAAFPRFATTHLRAARRAARQTRLKHSERMGGDMHSRAAEIERQEEERRARAQEELARREAERDRQRRDRRQVLQAETVHALEDQVRERDAARQREAHELAAFASEQARAAQVATDAAEQERRGARQRQAIFRKDLDLQAERRRQLRAADALGMNSTELLLNAHLLQDVVRQRRLAAGDELVAQLAHSPAFEHRQDQRSV